MTTVDLGQMSMHDRIANTIRGLAMDAIQKANSGHPGMPMGMADVATVLWRKFYKVNPADPAWPDGFGPDVGLAECPWLPRLQTHKCR